MHKNFKYIPLNQKVTETSFKLPSPCKRKHFMSSPKEDFIKLKVSEKIQSHDFVILQVWKT
jgi:hypothetical protein